jgi:hypothetical protein
MLTAGIAAPGMSHVSPSGTAPAGRTGWRDFFSASQPKREQDVQPQLSHTAIPAARQGRGARRAPWAEVHMLKPIIFEVAVMFVAASSYLFHREFGSAQPAAGAASAEAHQTLRAQPGAVKTALPDLQTVQAWVVPATAVQHVDGKDYLFVEKSPGEYQRVQVQGHTVAADHFVVTSGLDAAAPVVVAGAAPFNQQFERAP